MVLRFNQYTPPDVRFQAFHVVKDSGCWEWIGDIITSKRGDRRPRLTINKKAVSAYRFSYELHIGPIPDGLMVCHHCDNSICVNPEHLFVGTNSDNQRDSSRKGRAAAQKYYEAFAERARQLGKRIRPQGAYGTGKLTIDQKRQAYQRRLAGEQLADIAADFGVTKQCISQSNKREAARAALAAARGEGE